MDFTANNFDLTKLSADWTSFFDGFTGSNLKLTRMVSINTPYLRGKFYSSWEKDFKSLTVNSASSGRFNGFDSQGVYSVPSGTLTYSGDKVLQNLVTNPIGFVVGNNPDQYPTNGEKIGYWYELIGQITSTNALSLSDSAYDLTRDTAVEEIRKEVVTNGVNS